MEERLSAGRDYGNSVLPTQLCREPVTALKIKAVHFLKMFDLVSSLLSFFVLVDEVPVLLPYPSPVLNSQLTTRADVSHGIIHID